MRTDEQRVLAVLASDPQPWLAAEVRMESGLTRRQCRRALARLAASGVVEREEVALSGRQRSWLYSLPAREALSRSEEVNS